jgi:hypothetical protein
MADSGPNNRNSILDRISELPLYNQVHSGHLQALFSITDAVLPNRRDCGLGRSVGFAAQR